MDFTTPPLFWFLSGVVLFILEMVVPGFVLFFFGVGAWITALLSWLLPIGINSQILIFTVFSVVALLVLRRLVKKSFSGDSTNENEEDSLAEKGALVEIIQDIVPPAEGKVKYSGTTWRATADSAMRDGDLAEIVEQQGLVIKVKPVTNNQ
ncbi:NfeD family protein [Desulfopila sp. IMCC35008]|uniref:NfeD family protein n=1 Tax=Desulfopila sp. IMCC35008 TaxID=2653858 RepID=UPI0013D17538|nr:NfeD family protein [Desulfopila sp. IMCC35008]